MQPHKQASRLNQNTNNGKIQLGQRKGGRDKNQGEEEVRFPLQ